MFMHSDTSSIRASILCFLAAAVPARRDRHRDRRGE
jgi:hypothetical protein